MLHLSPERLAALADDEPTAAEATHLASCAACAAERTAHRTLLALAHREAGRPGDRLTSWDTLAADLRMEGLIGPPADPMTITPTHGTRIPQRHRSFDARGWIRAAAAVVLVAAGAAAGRISAGAPVLARGPSTEVGETGGAPVVDPAGFSTVAYGSTTDAMTAFLRAQREMQQAAAFLAEREQGGAAASDADMYRARLAALDGMVSVSRAALYEAPADPVINQYYLATLGAREATMRQIGRTLPAGTQVTPY
jgi:hypothetical protein